MILPSPRLRLSEREWNLVDFALARREALYYRNRATDNARQGFDAALTRRFARQAAAKARATYKLIMGDES